MFGLDSSVRHVPLFTSAAVVSSILEEISAMAIDIIHSRRIRDRDMVRSNADMCAELLVCFVYCQKMFAL